MSTVIGASWSTVAPAAGKAVGAAGKSSTVRRELILHELVIPDLVQMLATAKYDKNVLLSIQDGYVSQAMKENAAELVSFQRNLVDTPMSHEQRWQRRIDYLSELTRAVYKRSRGESRGGYDLREYVEAARAFFESEGMLYAGQLQDVGEYLKKSLEAGVKPDVERFARESYLSMARMAGAIKNLKAIGTPAGAALVAEQLSKSFETIKFAAVTTPGRSIQVGRELFAYIEKISAAPEKYMQFVDPYKLSAPKADIWDYEPIRRSNSPDYGM